MKMHSLTSVTLKMHSLTLKPVVSVSAHTLYGTRCRLLRLFVSEKVGNRQAYKQANRHIEGAIRSIVAPSKVGNKVTILSSLSNIQVLILFP